MLIHGIFNVDESAIRTARAMGYDNVQVTDHAWFAVGWRGCEVTDASRFRLEAINPSGVRTKIEVCMGWPFKNGTIRVNWWDDAGLPESFDHCKSQKSEGVDYGTVVE